MEGIALSPRSRLGKFAGEHREISFCRVDGVLYAWIPAGWDRAVGRTAHGYTEAELLAKLTATLGG